jgi:LPXTG-site transpeptidase (sortase) family protein
MGIVVVVVGAADAFTRLAQALPNVDVSFTSFAPAALIVDPELRGQVKSASIVQANQPTKLFVPSLGIEAAVEPVGKKADGSMNTPKALANVAWYKLGQMPGEPGNAVFAGHVNSALGLPGVFTNLSQMQVGHKVEVLGEDGDRLVYEVERVTEYYLDRAPLEEIFANSGPSRLVLITCEGDWDSTARTYDKRLVVVARLINP